VYNSSKILILFWFNFLKILDWSSSSAKIIERNDERLFRIYFCDTSRAADKINIRINDNYFASIDF
jgi:hypothetical protein